MPFHHPHSRIRNMDNNLVEVYQFGASGYSDLEFRASPERHVSPRWYDTMELAFCRSLGTISGNVVGIDEGGAAGK